MNETTSATEAVVVSDQDAADVVFATLSVMEFETMTESGVEFVLCASALTAQM